MTVFKPAVFRVYVGCALPTVLAVGACTTVHLTEPINASGRPTMYETPDSPGVVAGNQIESQDIISTTDGMVRDMLANPQVAGLASTPRIRIDSSLIRNQSSQVINLNLFTDRLRTGLVRGANGRMLFVSRTDTDELVKERKLKRSGIADGGGLGLQEKIAGVDYRLQGNIADQTGVSNTTGLQSRFFQITFQLVDQETGIIVWADSYSFKKTSADDAIYR